MGELGGRKMGQVESREGAGDAVLLCADQPKVI